MANEARVLRRLRRLCLALPEVAETRQFGHPVWKAGKRTFCALERYGGRLRVAFKVDPDAQSALLERPGFARAPYSGHHGWVLLDAERSLDWGEVDHWVTESYRRVALQRMRRALEALSRRPLSSARRPRGSGAGTGAAP
jgi:predicted DNA-binding protein (MmcQ/YjbR family)